MPDSLAVGTGILLGALLGGVGVIVKDMIPANVGHVELQKRRQGNLSPPADALYIDPKLIDLFQDVSRFRKYNERAYVMSLRGADRMCLIQVELEEPSTDFDTTWVPRLVQRAKESYTEAVGGLKDLWKTVRESEREDIDMKQHRKATDPNYIDPADFDEQEDEQVDQYADSDEEDAKQRTKARIKGADRLKNEILSGWISQIMSCLDIHQHLIEEEAMKYRVTSLD